MSFSQESGIGILFSQVLRSKRSPILKSPVYAVKHAGLETEEKPSGQVHLLLQGCGQLNEASPA